MNTSIFQYVSKLNLKSYNLKSFCEIGLMYGATIKFIYENFNVEKYYAIDPFISYDDYKIDGFCRTIEEKSGDALYNKILNDYQHYKNIEIIRDFSSNAIKLIPDNSLDFVYIDGNHAYEYTYQDISNIYPKIKMGGIICGDDYYMRYDDYNQKMVYEAVEQFTKENDISYQTDVNHGLYDSFWFFIKNKTI